MKKYFLIAAWISVFIISGCGDPTIKTTERMGTRPPENNGSPTATNTIPGENGAIINDDPIPYYGCPNSKRIKKLNMSKKIRMLSQ